MTHVFKLEFVDNIPDQLREGILYVSMKFHTTAHLCACGCGEKVINPLNRKYGWTLTFDGKRVSLSPSIGNYQFPCQSHYYIKENEVIFLNSAEEKRQSKDFNQSVIVWFRSLFKKIFYNGCLKHAAIKKPRKRTGK